MNIALVGMMGSGKSAVGRQLSQELGFAFVDTDELVVQRAGKSASRIFAEDGEARFRELEQQAVAQATSLDRTVIACGGGAVASEANLRALLSNALVFYLKLAPDAAAARIADVSARPMLKGGNASQALTQLLEKRAPAYEKAHFEVDASDRVQQSVAQMQSILSAPARVCAVISATGLSGAAEQIKQAVSEGADVVELRLDLIGAREEEVGELARVCTQAGVHFIATCRSASEGGRFSGGTEKKLRLLARASREGAAFVDVELLEEKLLEEVKAEAEVKSKVIASFHDFSGRTGFEELREILRRQEKVADAGKIACKTDVMNARQVLELQAEANERKFPLVLTPMGEGVLPTRVACALAGSLFTYAAAGKSTAPGQPALAELKKILESLRFK